MKHAWLLVVLALACSRNSGERSEASSPTGPPATKQAAEPDDDPPADEAASNNDDAHRVVFADRTSQGYLLLVDDAHKSEPSRQELVALVKKELSTGEANPELDLLVALIQTEPTSVDPRIAAQQGKNPFPAPDLLGLYVDVVPISSHGGDLVSTEQLTDPVLTRALSPEERKSLAKRNQAILIRADYRNQHAVRGLRLLQTLVREVARERDALIHDPDTGETMGVEAFTKRRLQNSLGNIADQVAVVPFPDKRHGAGSLRLATRGMRRFGSVDLELDGLPRDPAVLQAATDLLYGLAYQMVRQGEFDVSGYAVELGDELTITRDDVVQAYGRKRDDVPACEDCPQKATVHLVERESEPHDPADHVVARVVAPRPQSDAPEYEHAAWVRQTLQRLFGT